MKQFSEVKAIKGKRFFCKPFSWNYFLKNDPKIGKVFLLINFGAYLGHFMQLKDFIQETDGDLRNLILAIADASKELSTVVRNAPITNLTGALENTNVQGEIVQKLDDYSNRVLMDFCTQSGSCAGYLSEENEGIVTLNKNGSLIVAVDPLDGSSNIDIAAPIGTIFAIWKRLSNVGEETAESDYLQNGNACIASGYVLYGSAAMLMFTTRNGVHLFGLNTETNEYELVNEKVELPIKGKIYSLNQANLAKFEKVASVFVFDCIAKGFSLRYIGSMVGDLYRTFLKGGVFLYPANEGETKGKLRLLYECIPMSLLAEQAGGKSTNGKQRILDIQPTALHERCAIVIGSSDLVNQYIQFSN